jgi:hypothetical protein
VAFIVRQTYPIDAVFIVSRREDLTNDELRRTCDSAGLISEIRVLEQNASILFVDTDSILDGLRLA